MEALIWETADELDQKLASRLRNIRKRRAISQQRLADITHPTHVRQSLLFHSRDWRT